MAAIDASIGIKTAVNFDNRKNKLGTYCPPLGVFIDRCATHLDPFAVPRCTLYIYLAVLHPVSLLSHLHL